MVLSTPAHLAGPWPLGAEHGRQRRGRIRLGQAAMPAVALRVADGAVTSVGTPGHASYG
jgi:hypothetical protein